VGNTDGEGVFIRKTPAMDDKVRAYSDGTALTIIGDDVDGDGIPDVVVGAPGASPGGLRSAGTAFVFSGATGKLLLRLDGQEADASFGASVAIAGDLDGDGRAEVLVGAPFASPGGQRGAGSVFAFGF